MKKFTKICTFLLVIAVAVAFCGSALAAGSVSYEGRADKFVFAPGTEESPTNLFENFQDVMPGDTRTEQILVKNDAEEGVKVKVYLRSLGAEEGSEEFLSQMNLTVSAEETVMFDAAASETAQLTDWVYLGTLYSGGEVVLDLTLEVPAEMGNEFQNQAGYLSWQFKVEELPAEPDDPTPDTGDSSNILLYAAVMAVCALAFIVILFARKRKNAEEN